VTAALGGFGLFGVELFRQGRRGIVQRGVSAASRYGNGDDDFAGSFRIRAACAGSARIADSRYRAIRAVRSVAVLASGYGRAITYAGLAEALVEPHTALRLFGKPEINGKRRLAVALARAETIDWLVKKPAASRARCQSK